MKKVKKLVALVLSIAIIMCSTLPSLATGNDVEQTYTSKIVEQLKEDLGEEKATEILNSDSESLSGETESSTTMDSNNGNDETTVEGSDNEESTGNDTVEEPEEDITETSTEPTKDNTNLTCTEEIVETSETDEYEIIATSSDLEDNLLLEVEESDGNNSNLFGDGEPWMWWYLTDGGQTLHLTSTQPASDGHSVTVTTTTGHIGYGSLTKSNVTSVVFDDEIEAQTGNYLFYNFTNLETINNMAYFNTNNVADMKYMFYGCSSLTSLDLSNFNTSNVTSMYCMFNNCRELTSLDLSNFDTSNVTDMNQMFLNCRGLTNLVINNFNTNNVTDMYNMFFYCSSLTSIDVSGFSTSNVTRMDGMFGCCTSLTTINISNFNTSSVTNMSAMFNKCSSLTSLNVGSFNTSNVTNMSSMFRDCSNLTSLDLSNFNTSNVTDMSSMFSGCYEINTLNINTFDTSNVTNMCGMFGDCYSLASLDLSNFNTSNVTSMSSMFEMDGANLHGYTINLTSINLSSFDTSNVTNMSYMFDNCSSLISLNVSSFDTSNVTDMFGMFEYCSALTSLNLSNFNTSNVSSSTMGTGGGMDCMFEHCSSLISVDVSSFDTSNVTGMNSMFCNCSNLTSLDLSSFDTSNVTGSGMRWMFLGCSSLTSLDVSNFNTSNVTDMCDMFSGCSSLTSIDVSSFDTSNVTDMTGMFASCSALQTVFASNNFVTNNVTDSNVMFSGCTSLVGGNNTSFDSSHTNKEYARIDAPGTPGYFTLSGSTGPILSSISVNLPPTKVKYKVGEHFDPAGLKIDLNYSDSTTDSVIYSATTMSAFTFTPATTSELTMTDTNITIGYGNKTTTQVIEVIEPTSISVKPNTNLKVKYAIGESFDPTNLSINMTYSDTTTIETVTYVGNESDFSFSPSQLNTAGLSIPVTITYTKSGTDFTCTQNVEVVELSSISVNLPPTTTRYIKGTNFDPTGLKINLNYSDSTTETVTYSTTTSTNFTFNGVSTLTLNTVGNPFVVTIEYAGKTCTQNVIVAELSGIAITTHATKLNYNEGDTFDPTGLVITLTYSDSVTQPIAYNTTTSSDFTFSPTGALTRTGNVITIQYKTFNTMTMEETLNVKELTSIAVTTNPAKLSYASGQSLNPNGLVLTLTYTDSNDAVTTDTVTYNSTTQNKFDFNPSGVLTSSGNITITYDGKTGTNLNPTFAITVYQIASISVVNRPSTTSYNVGSKLNPNGLVIKVNKVGGASENIAYSSGNSSDFTFNPSLSTNLNTGHTNVTVTYGGKSTTFAISVTQSSGGYVPSGGGGSTGGSGGSGGGGGGGGGIPTGNNPLNNTPTTTQVAANKSISATISGDTSSWVADPISGKWKLNVTLGNGQVAPASNGFYLLTNTITEVINGIIVPKQVNNTYYFDVQGNMVTGWVQTADSKWYFFENAKTAEEGKMSIGWKQVQGSWYYFTLDGSMMASGITPDGFIIGADGKWIQQ